MGLIALFLWLALALVCLRKEAGQVNDISSAIWLPLIWMLRVGSRAFNYWFPGDLGSWGDPVILTALTIIGLMVLAQRAAQVQLLFGENRAFLFFLIFMSLSVLWTDDVLDAFKRWFRTVGDVTMAMIVLTERNPFASILCVIRRSVLVLIPLSLVISLFFPAWGVGEDGAWTGATVDKNWLGLLCFLAAASFLWNWIMRKRRPELAVDIRLAGLPFEIPYLALSLFLLWGGTAGARSSSAIVLLALAIGLFLLIDYVRNNHIKVGSLVAILVLGMLFFQGLPRLTGHRTLSDHIIEDVLHKDVNLTDRADFWPLLIKMGMAHPLLGSGFDSFFTTQTENKIQAALAEESTFFKPTQAHNGYLQIFLNLGLAGLLLLGLTIFGAFKGIKQLLRDDFEFGRFRLILLAGVLVSNWTEATFGRPNEYLWFLFLLVVINPVYHPAEVPAEDHAFEASAHSESQAHRFSSFAKDAGQERRIW